MALSSTAPWTAYYGSTPATLDYPHKTMYQLLSDAAAKFPKNTAYVFMGKQTSYAAFMQREDLPALKLVCAILPESKSLRGVLETARAAGQDDAVLLIGPEGDFSPAEYAAAQAGGYVPISLGPIILRVETAVFMVVSAVRYALDATQ